MREFFRSRERKLGIVVLMLACVFMTGWMWSLNTVYEYSIGELQFLAAEKYEFFVLRSENGQISLILQKEPFYHQRLKGGAKIYRATVFEVSYFFLTTPLTLLSAWLLLSRSRPAKRAESPATNANCGRQNG